MSTKHKQIKIHVCWYLDTPYGAVISDFLTNQLNRKVSLKIDFIVTQLRDQIDTPLREQIKGVIKDRHEEE